MCKHRDKYNIYQKFSTQDLEMWLTSRLCVENFPFLFLNLRIRLRNSLHTVLLHTYIFRNVLENIDNSIKGVVVHTFLLKV